MIDSIFTYLKKRTVLSQKMYLTGDEDVIQNKSYKRFERVELPKPKQLDVSLSDAFMTRKTTREFSVQHISLEEVSSLLFWSTGILPVRNALDKPVRAHPSGGGKFPVEVYPIVFNAEGIPAGGYHYNVTTHSLERLPFSSVADIRSCFKGHQFALDAGIILLISFVKGHSMATYGQLSYKLGLLEGGHIGQNVYLASTALDLGCCAMGDVDVQTLYKLMRIDGINEHIFYSLAIGKKTKNV